MFRPATQQHAAFGTIGDSVYVAGGFGNGSGHWTRIAEESFCVDHLQVYNVKTETWARMARMPSPRATAVGIVRDGKLLVVSRNGFFELAVRRSLILYPHFCDRWEEFQMTASLCHLS